MLSTKIRRRYSLRLDPMLCRNFAYHGGPLLCITPALAISVQPPSSSSGGHHFSLADTGPQLCAPPPGNGIYSKDVTADKPSGHKPVEHSFHGSVSTQVGLTCDH